MLKDREKDEGRLSSNKIRKTESELESSLLPATGIVTGCSDERTPGP